ncbi:HutD family protein [Mangrovimonas sp. DI 80]|uniref:HutD/Ves family protein n=1 Tax=Mangrovimonas sp. DI 80 TaxID=1779330 RepID=UPI00097806B9|nr:HutD family protein [Mangrovimonas sp. DI 80]OMP30865.1 hypothetical protein BKM32_11625 [Mangrovimonas sp. DI 80]
MNQLNLKTLNYSIYMPDNFTSKPWSGGSTTELCIFPPEASYQAMDFDFRLSTATVDVETSEFTRLPGISRQLMVLEGNVTLEHQNHHSVTLNEGDIDCFDGDWTTTSYGTCTDFNLMTSKDIKGKLTALDLKLYKRTNLEIDKTASFFGLYLYKGSLSIFFEDQQVNLQKGHLFCFKDPIATTLSLFANANCFGVVIEIEKD